MRVLNKHVAPSSLKNPTSQFMHAVDVCEMEFWYVPVASSKATWSWNQDARSEGCSAQCMQTFLALCVSLLKLNLLGKGCTCCPLPNFLARTARPAHTCSRECILSQQRRSELSEGVSEGVSEGASKERSEGVKE